MSRLRNPIIFFALAFVVLVATVKCDRQGRRQNGNGEFRSPCGTAEQVSKRLGACIQDILDVIDGKFGMPKSDDDLLSHCTRFNRTERCTRSLSKDCLTGLHKTAVGSVATGSRRFRIQECKSPTTRAKYMKPLECSIKNSKEIRNVFNNHTGIMQGVRDMNISPEEKLMKMCCVLDALDRDIIARLNKDCPESTPQVVGLIHALTDDARSTLCLAPKCNNALDKVINHKYTPPQNFVEPIGQIVFLVNTSN